MLEGTLIRENGTVFFPSNTNEPRNISVFALSKVLTNFKNLFYVCHRQIYPTITIRKSIFLILQTIQL